MFFPWQAYLANSPYWHIYLSLFFSLHYCEVFLVTSWSEMTHLLLHGSCSPAPIPCSRNCRSPPTSAKRGSLLLKHSYTCGYLTPTLFLGYSEVSYLWHILFPSIDGLWRSPVMHMQLLPFHSNPYAVLLTDLVFSKLHSSNKHWRQKKSAESQSRLSVKSSISEA